jgi:lipopolysaccharide/colanic/teichoic acid biosynthesis glycosyltransferase/O-antigen/teichoic acid export membrane protein
VAGAGLIVLAPLLALVAAAIRLTLGPPVIFRQQRPGLHGRPFTLYKFRTMTVADDADGRPLPDRLRLTRLGRILRRTSLDELPEFFNVIKGEMSLVGPRPLLMEYLGRYTTEQFRRHEVRPGITGWAQLNGRNTVPWEKRLALDVWYVDNLTFWLDLRILIRTVWTAASGTGVRQPGDGAEGKFPGSLRADGSRVIAVSEVQCPPLSERGSALPAVRGVQMHGVEALPLAHNASWGLLGSLTYAGCQWAMLVVLAKLGSAEMMGQFALGFAVSAPLFILANLSLRAVLVTDVRGDHRFGDYLALRLITTLAGLVINVGVAVLVGYRWETSTVIVLVGVAKAIEAVADILYGLMQKRERMDLMARSIVMRGVLSVLALGAGVYLTSRVLWGLVLMAAVWALVLVGYDLPTGRRLLGTGIRPRWERVDLVRLTGLSLPLGVTAMLISLSATVPRYFVERFRGEQELGAFVAMVSLVTIGSTVVNALGQSASPRLATYYAAGDNASAGKILMGLIGLGVLLGAAGVLIALAWGREVLTALYRPEYAEHVGAFVLIMLAGGISYVASFLWYAITSARLFRVQMPLFASVVAVALVVCAALVPSNGLLGAAQASVATCTANLLGVGAVCVYALGQRSTTRRFSLGRQRWT